MIFRKKFMYRTVIELPDSNLRVLSSKMDDKTFNHYIYTDPSLEFVRACHDFGTTSIDFGYYFVSLEQMISYFGLQDYNNVFIHLKEPELPPCIKVPKRTKVMKSFWTSSTTSESIKEISDDLGISLSALINLALKNYIRRYKERESRRLKNQKAYEQSLSEFN